MMVNRPDTQNFGQSQTAERPATAFSPKTVAGGVAEAREYTRRAGRAILQPPTCVPVLPPDLIAMRPRRYDSRRQRSGPVKDRHRSAHSTTQPNRTVTVRVVDADHLLLGTAWRNNRARLSAQRGIFAAATHSRPLPPRA